MDRFVSYYLERTNGKFEREVTGNRTIDPDSWLQELMLSPISVSSSLDMLGDRTLVRCQVGNVWCASQEFARRAVELPSAHQRVSGRSLPDWTPAEVRQYLSTVSRDGMFFNQEETGTFCNKERASSSLAALTFASVHCQCVLCQCDHSALEREYVRYPCQPGEHPVSRQAG